MTVAAERPELPQMTYEAPQTIKRMLFATWALLDTLAPELRTQAHLADLDDPRRVDWDFIPKPDRSGVPLSKLDHHQRTLAHSLIASGLSIHGYSQVLSVMATENVLREMEAVTRGFGVIAGEFRSPDGYWLTVFGRPAFEDTWGWRLIGHHLSLNFTVVAQRFLTITPIALGAMPIPAGVLNPLGEHEERALELLHALPPDLRSRAIVHDVAPADFVTRQVPLVGAEEWPDHVDLGIVGYQIDDVDREQLRFVRADPSGVRGSDLDGATLAMARNLLLHHVRTGPEEITSQYRDQVLTEDPRHLRFAWAGGTAADTAHYHRISTAGLLVEADNAVAAGQHLHTVWRDLANDLGHGLLLDHYREHGAHGEHLRRRLVSTRATAEAPLTTDTWFVPQVYTKR